MLTLKSKTDFPALIVSDWITRPAGIDPNFFYDLQKLGPLKSFSAVRKQIYAAFQQISTQKAIPLSSWSLFCDTKPCRIPLNTQLLLTDVTTVGMVHKLVWAFFCFAGLWLQKCCIFLLSASAFCLHVVQIWLPVVFKDISWNGHCIFGTRHSDVIEFSMCCF